MTFARLCLLIACAVLLGACARVSPPPPFLAPASNSAEANDAWERFATIAVRAENTTGPFRASGTLFYSGKEDSQRVSYYFWGNSDKKSLLPLRLDILMGHGQLLGRVREDSRGFNIFVPAEDTLFTHSSSGGLLAFGVPFPFSLAELASLVTGRYAQAFAIPGADITSHIPPAFASPDNTFIYEITGAPMGGRVCISPEGLPISWQENAENGWMLTIEYWPDSTRPTPRKLYIRHPHGNEATLIVRELVKPETPFTPEQLALTVPAGTRTESLGAPGAKAASALRVPEKNK